MSKRSHRFLALTAVFVLSSAGPASAFLQTTQAQGPIGQSIGGIWLAVHHVMPEFRVRFEKDVGLPFTVGEISEDLAGLVGDYIEGSEIKVLKDEKVTSGHGVFKGDIITRINGRVIKSQEDVDAVLATDVRAFLVTIRRPRLKFTEVGLIKLKYEPKMGEEDGTSVITDENIRVLMLDAVLPFANQVDKRRAKNELWEVSDPVLEDLGKHWHELPRHERAPFVGGKHRVVSKDNFDSALRSDENAKDASFAMISTLEGNPFMGGGQRIAMYGFRSVDPKRLSGTYVQATIASAPFPISIEFKGLFTLHKVADYSDADVELRKAAAKKKAAKEENWDEIELAPDIPENIPSETPGKDMLEKDLPADK